MLRIVKMEFESSHIPDFIEMFASKKSLIGGFEGCSGVKLLRDKNNPNIFFTYSKWKNEDALENYRNSELFLTTWKQTKQWFSAKPLAWSVDIIEES